MTLGYAAALGLIIDDAMLLWSKSIEPMRSILNLTALYYKSNSLSLSSHGRF
jgi:hypothetical protein